MACLSAACVLTRWCPPMADSQADHYILRSWWVASGVQCRAGQSRSLLASSDS